MSAQKAPRDKIPFLNIAVYLLLMAAGMGGILEIDTIFKRWAALTVLIIFSVLVTSTIDYRIYNPSRWNHAYLAGLTLLTSLLLVIRPGAIFLSLLFFILSVVAMLMFPPRLALLWIAVFAIITGINFISSMGWWDGLEILFPFTCGYVFVGTFTNALYRARAEKLKSEKLFIELQAAHQDLQTYAAQVEILAASEERNRLAREMHDTVGHHLTVSSVQLEAAQRLISSDSDRAASMLATARTQVSQALREIRQTVARLREPLEADLPLPRSLRQLAQSFGKATGLQIQLTFAEEWPLDLPATHQLAIYRATQEALTNIQRHAQANHAWIKLDCQENMLTVQVSDDGIGYAQSAESGEEKQGFGLLGLQERAVQMGGFMRIEDCGGRDVTCHVSTGHASTDPVSTGTQLTFCLPLPPPSSPPFREGPGVGQGRGRSHA